MPYWGPLRWLYFLLLVIFIGLPLLIIEKVTGKQPEWLIDWLDRKLS